MVDCTRFLLLVLSCMNISGVIGSRHSSWLILIEMVYHSSYLSTYAFDNDSITASYPGLLHCVRVMIDVSQLTQLRRLSTLQLCCSETCRFSIASSSHLADLGQLPSLRSLVCRVQFCCNYCAEFLWQCDVCQFLAE